MRATKTKTKTTPQTVGTNVLIPAKATRTGKSASGNAAKTTKSTSNSTVATSRVTRTADSPKAKPSIEKSALVRHGIADWRADDADWTQLRADRYRPAWHLAALAFGLKPLEDLEMRLQAKGRTDEKKAYGNLVRTLENNLTRVDHTDRLQYVRDEADDSIANDSAKRKIDRFVDVAKFVRFVDSRDIIINERLWSIANLFVDVAQSTRPAISTTSATMAGNPVPKPSTPDATGSSLSNDDKGAELNSNQVGTLARILVALAIHHYNYNPTPAFTEEHEKRKEGGTYAPILRICKEFKFTRPSEWETVQRVLLKASNKIGIDQVRYAVGRHQELVRQKQQAVQQSVDPDYREIDSNNQTK